MSRHACVPFPGHAGIEPLAGPLGRNLVLAALSLRAGKRRWATNFNVAWQQQLPALLHMFGKSEQTVDRDRLAVDDQFA